MFNKLCVAVRQLVRKSYDQCCRLAIRLFMSAVECSYNKTVSGDCSAHSVHVNARLVDILTHFTSLNPLVNNQRQS